jgi:tripartite-type tricarboxylate transporter receptor subunit TctC
MKLFKTLGLGLAFSCAIISNSAFSQTYPNKQIRLVVTFPSGGAPDILARIFAEKAQLGQTVFVDNKPGAGGNIGADFVAKSAGDGYTIVMGTVGTHSINGGLYAKMPYDMVKDFTPVSLLASTPNLLVINNNIPAKNVQELMPRLTPTNLFLARPVLAHRCMYQVSCSNRKPA